MRASTMARPRDHRRAAGHHPQHPGGSTLPTRVHPEPSIDRNSAT
ncbi:hypothetical protein ABLO16_17035 [Mycobacterium tuberculosis]